MASSVLGCLITRVQWTRQVVGLQLQLKSILLDKSFKFGKDPVRMLSTYPKLTPQQVNRILKAFEISHDVKIQSSVRDFDTNQLPSNNPIEDRRIEARCLQTTGMLFAIIDGHGGSACAEVVCQRLPFYVAAGLLPYEILKEYAASLEGNRSTNLLELYNNEVVFRDELRAVHQNSFKQYVGQLLKSREQDKEFKMEDTLIHAFCSLDSHLSSEAQMKLNESVHNETVVSVATGCVACLVHIDGPHLHVAQAGDCQAVLGTLDETNAWVPKVLTKCHNTDNEAEVNRILSEHPKTEAHTVLVNNRLLGQLAPLRAFGDFQYKWPLETFKKILSPLVGSHYKPPSYFTPPYLTASPEVTYCRLSPRDRFVVIGSDGLWDMLSPEKVVKLVGEYMLGIQTFDPVVISKVDITLKEVLEILNARKAGRELKPHDQNAATHLVRNALGRTEYGVEHSMLSQMLSAPEDVVRLIRDDITITVIFINDDYIRHCPA